MKVLGVNFFLKHSVVWLLDGEKFWRYVYLFRQSPWTWRTDVQTDRQTDGRTDTARRHRPRWYIASRGKNLRCLSLITVPTSHKPIIRRISCTLLLRTSSNTLASSIRLWMSSLLGSKHSPAQTVNIHAFGVYKKLSYRWHTAQLSLTYRAILVCKVIEVWQDFLSECVDKKFSYICYRRLIRHEWIYYGSKKCVIYNS